MKILTYIYAAESDPEIYCCVVFIFGRFFNFTISIQKDVELIWRCFHHHRCCCCYCSRGHTENLWKFNKNECQSMENRHWMHMNTSLWMCCFVMWFFLFFWFRNFSRRQMNGSVYLFCHRFGYFLIFVWQCIGNDGFCDVKDTTCHVAITLQLNAWESVWEIMWEINKSNDQWEHNKTWMEYYGVHVLTANTFRLFMYYEQSIWFRHVYNTIWRGKGFFG